MVATNTPIDGSVDPKKMAIDLRRLYADYNIPITNPKLAPFWVPGPFNITVSGTPVGLGNAVLGCRYQQMGKLVTTDIQFTIGSTTTIAGSGYWQFLVPVASAGYSNYGVWLAQVAADNTTYYGVSFINSTGYITMFLQGTNTLVGETHPVAWATGDSLNMQITYEAS